MYTWAIATYHGSSLKMKRAYYSKQAVAFKLAKGILLDEDIRGVGVINLVSGEVVHMQGEAPAPPRW